MDPAKLASLALKTVIQAIVLVLVSSLAAAFVNAVRPEPLPWIAAPDFVNLIYTDCPETEANAEAIAIADVLKNPGAYLIVDSREAETFAGGHIAGAISVPYDSLFAMSKEDLARVRLQAGSRKVVVVGQADAARELAAEMVSNGLKNIYYLAGDGDWQALMGAAEQGGGHDAE